MKTMIDEKLNHLSNTTTPTEILKSDLPVARPLKSLRPMKSMVKISSLKPQRIQVGAKLKRKAIKA